VALICSSGETSGMGDNVPGVMAGENGTGIRGVWCSCADEIDANGSSGSKGWSDEDARAFPALVLPRYRYAVSLRLRRSSSFRAFARSFASFDGVSCEAAMVKQVCL